MDANEFALQSLPYQQRRLRHLRRIFGVSLHSLRDKELLKSVSGASVSCYYTLNEVERDGTTGKLLYTSGNSTDLDNPNWKAVTGLDRQQIGSLKRVLLTYWLLVGQDALRKPVWHEVVSFDSLQYLGNPTCLDDIRFATKSTSEKESSRKSVTESESAEEQTSQAGSPCFYIELFNELQQRGSSISGSFQMRSDLYCLKAAVKRNERVEHESVVRVELKRTRVSCSADELRRLVSLCSRVAQVREANCELRRRIEAALGERSLAHAAQRDRLSEAVRREEDCRLTQRVADATAARTRLARLVSACDACDCRRTATERDAAENCSRVNALQESRRNLRLKLEHAKAHLRERRRELVSEIGRVYPIVIAPTASTIRGVCLPKLAELENAKNLNDMRQASVALGFAVHLVDLIANVFSLKLRYPLRFFGSRSTIEDPITEMRMLDERNESVPLYLSRKVNRDCYKYALYLLSENIDMLRYCLGRPSAADSGYLLLSLYQLVESLIRERPRFAALARLVNDTRRFAQTREPRPASLKPSDSLAVSPDAAPPQQSISSLPTTASYLQ